MKKNIILFAIIILLIPITTLANNRCYCQNNSTGAISDRVNCNSCDGFTCEPGSTCKIIIAGSVNIESEESCHTLNVPFGNVGKTQCIDFGDYVQLWYNFAVGAVGIMATVIIMWAGFKWLTSRGDSSVISDAKDRINGAVIGLALVFLSYIILSVINPDLLKIELPGLKGVDITTIEAERQAGSTVSGGNNSKEGSYIEGATSQEVKDFVNNLNGGNSISEITVQASNIRGRSSVVFTDSNGNQIILPAEIGVNGVAETNPQEGDQKTPVGTYQIVDNNRIATGPNDAIFTYNGKTNLGSAFIRTSIATSDGRNRSIGFHGSAENGLRPTNGCIRLNNGPLQILGPQMKPGTTVNIKKI